MHALVDFFELNKSQAQAFRAEQNKSKRNLFLVVSVEPLNTKLSADHAWQKRRIYKSCDVGMSKGHRHTAVEVDICGGIENLAT